MILAVSLTTYNALKIDCNAIVEHHVFNHPFQGRPYSVCINVGLGYMGMHVHQSSTSIIVYKNLPMSTEIIIQIIYWYLVGISKREILHSQVVIWVNTIQNYIDTRGIIPTCEGSCMVYTYTQMAPKTRMLQILIFYQYPKTVKSSL